MKQKMVEGEDGQETSHAGIPSAISRKKERQCDKNLTRSLPLKSFETIHLSIFSFFFLPFSGGFSAGSKAWHWSHSVSPRSMLQLTLSHRPSFSALRDDFFGILSRDLPGTVSVYNDNLQRSCNVEFFFSWTIIYHENIYFYIMIMIM